MRSLYLGLSFSLGVFMALLAAFVGSGATNGAAAVLLGAWGACWLMLAGGMVVSRYNASDAVDHFEDDYRPPSRYLQPPVQHHVLTIRHDAGRLADSVARPQDVEVVGEVPH